MFRKVSIAGFMTGMTMQQLGLFFPTNFRFDYTPYSELSGYEIAWLRQIKSVF